VEALRRARASDRPMRSLSPLMAVIILAQARGDRAVVRQLQEAVRPFQQVLLPMLPPWMARAYGDQIFDPRPEASSGSPRTEGLLVDVQVATSVALDYVRSIGAEPVIRLAPALVDAGASQPSREDLTVREREVLRAMTSGASNKELSKELGISAKTVMHHTSSIYRKLGVRGRSEAVAWALRHHRHEGVDGEQVPGA
jgi:DNA-binding CsgD family transcriptional regulator